MLCKSVGHLKNLITLLRRSIELIFLKHDYYYWLDLPEEKILLEFLLIVMISLKCYWNASNYCTLQITVFFNLKLP